MRKGSWDKNKRRHKKKKKKLTITKRIMYTANITDVQKKDTTISVTVEYLKDGNVFSTSVFDNADLPTIKTRVINRLKELEKIDSIDPSSVLGPVDLTPFPFVSTPTKEDVARRDFASNLDIFQKMLRAISLGLKTDKDEDFVFLQNQLKAEFLPEYLDLI